MQLKIAIVGVGSMGTNHLRVLRDLDKEGVQLVGIAEPNEVVLAHAMKSFHVAGYTDYRKMVAETKPDLVSIVVPTEMHFEVASFMIEAGANVLIEKPITSTLEQANILIKLASSRGVRIAVGHIERFNPAILELKKRLTNGSLGQIFSLHARRIGPFPPRIRDVGVILDLATHDLDIMRYLTGSEVQRVKAEYQQRVHKTHEDMLQGLLRFANNSIGVLDVNWLTPTKVRELTITGEKGMFLVNYINQDLFFYENDYSTTSWDILRTTTGVSEGTMTRLKIQKAEPLRLEYEHIIEALCNDTPLTVTGADGLAALSIAQQLVKAAHEEKTIWAMQTA